VKAVTTAQMRRIDRALKDPHVATHGDGPRSLKNNRRLVKSHAQDDDQILDRLKQKSKENHAQSH